MMPSDNKRRFWIGAVYFLPLAFGMVLFIWALVPHLFFIYGDDAKETMSLLELMRNTWTQCRQTLKSVGKNSSTAIYFSWAMLAMVAFSWLTVIGNAVVSICSAVCAGVAFSKPADDPTVRCVGRWMRFFCFNPVIYTLTCCAACVPFFVPLLLEWFYRNWFVYEMSLNYFGPPSWVVAVVLALGSGVTFAATRRLQREMEMDLFASNDADTERTR